MDNEAMKLKYDMTGTDAEEVVYDKKKNRYFITRVAAKGTDYFKNLRVLRASPGEAQTNKEN